MQEKNMQHLINAITDLSNKLAQEIVFKHEYLDQLRKANDEIKALHEELQAKENELYSLKEENNND